MTILMLIGTVFMIIWEMLYERISLNSVLLLLLMNLWVGSGWNVYIPHRKYQAKPHSSQWLSAACAAAIVYRNHFFHLYEQNISSESKVKFRQASNLCKGFLKLLNLHMLIKQKNSSSLPRNLALGTFGELVTVLLKINC